MTIIVVIIYLIIIMTIIIYLIIIMTIIIIYLIITIIMTKVKTRVSILSMIPFIARQHQYSDQNINLLNQT